VLEEYIIYEVASRQYYVCEEGGEEVIAGLEAYYEPSEEYLKSKEDVALHGLLVAEEVL
ncbi:hypothetical protein P7K49_039014, partial [Saguinus oedipus]